MSSSPLLRENIDYLIDMGFFDESERENVKLDYEYVIDVLDDFLCLVARTDNVVPLLKAQIEEEKKIREAQLLINDEEDDELMDDEE